MTMPIEHRLITDEEAVHLARGYSSRYCSWLQRVADRSFSSENGSDEGCMILEDLSVIHENLEDYDEPGTTEREVLALFRWVLHTYNLTEEIPPNLVGLANDYGYVVKTVLVSDANESLDVLIEEAIQTAKSAYRSNRDLYPADEILNFVEGFLKAKASRSL